MAVDPGNRLPFAGGCFVEVFTLGLGIQALLVPFLPPGWHLPAVLLTALLTEFLPEVVGDYHNSPHACSWSLTHPTLLHQPTARLALILGFHVVADGHDHYWHDQA